ncbi:DUF1194 domain-containing protein [Actibacterium mucosum]|uniref:DUF1194 domain-containing protein n=1 Tax=Actibacterium mucosum TaxID=1087332 RepID=UPI00068D3BD9|nr:DUF1194 domain-containing protein [Actibacterium mucosum]
MAALCGAAAPAQAACRLALLIGLDISSSVDAREDALQRAGMAAALRAPDVQKALLTPQGASVALAIYEWSGRYKQVVVVDWRVLDSVQAINAVASQVETSRRTLRGDPTAIGHSLDFADQMFADAPRCDFQTLDLTSDGVNNDGYGPAVAYRRGVLAETTVNVLAVGGSTTDDQTLYDFHIDKVLRGPGSFIEIARDYSDFARAMHKKLYREVELQVFGNTTIQAPKGG